MNSHNLKSDLAGKKESIRIVADKDDVRVIRTNLAGPAELSISDDDDRGGDPYNSTGQHAIIKSKLITQD